MRIIGFFRKESGETVCVSRCCVDFGFEGRLTSSALLVELLLTYGPSLNHEAVSTLPSALALVIPLVAQECLPCSNDLLLVPTTFNRLLYADINAHRLERIVSAMHGRKIASSTDIIEVEGVGA
jgi:hypothetical protein